MPLYSREEGQVIIVNEDTRSDDVSQDEANGQDKAEDFCLPSEIKNNIGPRQRSKQFFTSPFPKRKIWLKPLLEIHHKITTSNELEVRAFSTDDGEGEEEKFMTSFMLIFCFSFSVCIRWFVPSSLFRAGRFYLWKYRSFSHEGPGMTQQLFSLVVRS